MNWIEKLDGFWKGLLIGIIFPLIIFFFYWMFFHHQLNFPRGFYRYLTNGNLLSNVIKMCCIGNLLLFYFGITKKIDKFNKGILVSVIIYLGLILFISYYMEAEVILY